MKFSGKDIEEGYMVCAICRDRVFILSDELAQPENLCLKCNCFTVELKDFKNVKVTEIQG